MPISIAHTDPAHHPLAARLAKEIHHHLPRGQAELTCASKTALDKAELVLAVFSLEAGALAPVEPCYRKLRGKKVAFLAILAGPVDQSRLRQTVGAIKKLFCGNQLLAGYLCSVEDQVPWGLSPNELSKALDFTRQLIEEHGSGPAHQPGHEEHPLAVNY